MAKTAEARIDGRRWLIVAGVALVVAAFLAGFIPMWFHSRGYEGQLKASRNELQTVRLESMVAGAAIDARLGKYEQARQTASTFYQSLQDSLARPMVPLSGAQREQLALILDQRDEVITLLARGDPASAERLTQVYLAARKALAGP